jgi:hypothetical protein
MTDVTIEYTDNTDKVGDYCLETDSPTERQLWVQGTRYTQVPWTYEDGKVIFGTGTPAGEFTALVSSKGKNDDVKNFTFETAWMNDPKQQELFPDLKQFGAVTKWYVNSEKGVRCAKISTAVMPDPRHLPKNSDGTVTGIASSLSELDPIPLGDPRAMSRGTILTGSIMDAFKENKG